MARDGILGRGRRRLERLADHPALIRGLGAGFGRYLAHVHARTDWQTEGRAAFAAERAEGPAIVVSWHERLAFAPLIWDPAWGEVCSVTSRGRPGRAVAEMLARQGWHNVAMHDRRANRAASLGAARMARAGVTLAFAPDGPLGPPRRMKAVPVDWARLTGRPIWLFAGSASRLRRLPSWDRMLLPRPGGAGRLAWRRWGTVPPRLSPAERDRVRADLEAALDALSDETDRALGHPSRLV